MASGAIRKAGGYGASLALLLAAAALPATEASADGRKHVLSEFFVGVADHDTGVFGRNKEDGPNVNVEWRFDAPDRFAFWRLILSPRPTLGLNVNTRGDTSSLYAGVTWTPGLFGNFYFDWTMGGAVHDGKLSTTRPDRKELGSRVLFYLAAGLGYRLGERYTISLRLDHLSNAGLGGDNEGIDTVAVRLSYRF